MGTRSDICTLLKDSQYLMEANQTELHNAVSGALDRLHYEHDPCVKYDPKRKIWIYLHRGRTMEEFGMLHFSIILKVISDKFEYLCIFFMNHLLLYFFFSVFETNIIWSKNVIQTII